MPIPRALLIVAAFFLLVGIGAVARLVLSLFLGDTLHIDFGIIGLWIGAGLLATNGRALAWARFSAVLSCLVGLFALWLAITGVPATIRLFGWATGPVSRPIAIALVASMLGFFGWQWRVLERTEVKALFEEQPTPPA